MKGYLKIAAAVLVLAACRHTPTNLEEAKRWDDSSMIYVRFESAAQAKLDNIFDHQLMFTREQYNAQRANCDFYGQEFIRCQDSANRYYRLWTMESLTKK